MKPFEYVRAKDVRQVGALIQEKPDGEAQILAGGTDLLGLMKDYIVTPSRLVNIKTIPNLGKIEADGKNGYKIGALVTLADLQQHADLRKNCAVLPEAIDLSAMPQIRHAATIAGNLCQRPRCWYFRDEHTICLKKGGNTCYAVNGENEYHAILGGSPCFIVHPSDPAPALIALGASVVISDGQKSRTMPLENFFVLPHADIHHENILQTGEMITHVLIPAPAANTKSAYVKEREKDSYDWALSSAAVALVRDQAGTIQSARIVLGGVAPVPWRATTAEKALVGQKPSLALLQKVAVAALAGAKPMTKNAYKIPLTEIVVRRALEQAIG